MSHTDLGSKGVVVVGAGLAGCLLALYLKKRGFDVHVFEARSDMRKAKTAAGRSINLVLTSRGIEALAGIGLAERLLKITVPVYGRMLHSVSGEVITQRYGPDDTYCNYSVSRSELNIELMDAAEKAGVHLHFDHPLDHVDVPNKTIYTHIVGKGHPYVKSVKAATIFGADGAGSRIRQGLKHFLAEKMEDKGVPLGTSYKELFMPANEDGSYKLNKDYLHIWPRGAHFLMALPNRQGSFTMTLYLPDEGKVSFKNLDSDAKVAQYFQEYYPDSVPLMPNYIQDYNSNPVGFLGTLYADQWVYKDCVALVGDAAHAITPFFGQGCNAAFESVRVLDRLIGQHEKKSPSSGASKENRVFLNAFEEYFRLRKPNGDAIAQMAIQNYHEMGSKTADQLFLLQKAVEIRLSQNFPIYLSRYAMVTHTLIPYDTCVKVGVIQQEILDELTKNMKTVEELDLKKAKELIDGKLVPFLKKHQITEKDYEDQTYQFMHAGSIKSKL